MNLFIKIKKVLVSQREVGKQTESFAHALKAALREDPDVILVGELRDLETIGMALTAAETGHLVFGTLAYKWCAPILLIELLMSFHLNNKDK